MILELRQQHLFTSRVKALVKELDQSETQDENELPERATPLQREDD